MVSSSPRRWRSRYHQSITRSASSSSIMLSSLFVLLSFIGCGLVGFVVSAGRHHRPHPKHRDSTSSTDSSTTHFKKRPVIQTYKRDPNDPCLVLSGSGSDVTIHVYDPSTKLVNCTGPKRCIRHTASHCSNILCKGENSCTGAKFYNITTPTDDTMRLLSHKKKKNSPATSKQQQNQKQNNTNDDIKKKIDDAGDGDGDGEGEGEGDEDNANNDDSDGDSDEFNDEFNDDDNDEFNDDDSDDEGVVVTSRFESDDIFWNRTIGKGTGQIRCYESACLQASFYVARETYTNTLLKDHVDVECIGNNACEHARLTNIHNLRCHGTKSCKGASILAHGDVQCDFAKGKGLSNRACTRGTTIIQTGGCLMCGWKFGCTNFGLPECKYGLLDPNAHLEDFTWEDANELGIPFMNCNEDSIDPLVENTTCPEGWPHIQATEEAEEKLEESAGDGEEESID